MFSQASPPVPVRQSSVRRLLCVAPKGGFSVVDRCGEFPGWDVCTVATLADAMRVLRQQRYLVGLLVDCMERFPSDVLGKFLAGHCDVQWIGVFERGAIASPACRQLVADYLTDYHTTPVNPALLRHTLGHAHGWAALREPVPSPRPALDARTISGDSEAITRLRAQISRVAKVGAPVLIWGESGTGKELVANAIHQQSARASGPFVPINCGAIPSNLIHSELFGHERGSFTGATRDKVGLIEAADNGTVFLDEIADLPMELQANLLRVLQEGTIYRVGGTRSIKVNARVIAASHVNLQRAVELGRFREDLYYRMNVLPIMVPALRERKADLPALIDEFFRAFETDKRPGLKGFSRAAMTAIAAHHWPGNVRELMNRVRRAMVLSEGRFITPEDLGLAGAAPAPVETQAPILTCSRAGAEKSAIEACLRQANHNISKAARELGVSRMTLYRLIGKHQIPL